jgi:ribosomal protein S26
MNETKVKCEGCGRTTPRHKTAPVFKRVFGESRKIYFCVSCAKHRGIGIQESKRRIKQGGWRKARPVRPSP